jgi:hypothetical protein
MSLHKESRAKAEYQTRNQSDQVSKGDRENHKTMEESGEKV